MILHNVCSKKFIEIFGFTSIPLTFWSFTLVCMEGQFMVALSNVVLVFISTGTGPDHFCDEAELGDFWIGK